MKITNDQALTLWKKFESLSDKTLPIKYSYFIAKNKRILKGEVELLQSLIEPTTEFKEYDQERISLAELHSDKNEHGNPVIKNNAYSLTENLEAFEKEFGALKEKYKDTIDDGQRRSDEYNSLLKEEIEFDCYKITVDNLPKEMEPRFVDLLMNSGLLED